MSDLMEDDKQQEVIFDDDFAVEFEEEQAALAGNQQVLDNDKVVLSKAELLAMQNNGSQQIEKLAELIAKQQQPVNVMPQQQVNETDEQYEARIHEELFTPGKTKKVLEEVINRATQPLVSQYQQTIARLQKQLAFNNSNGNSIIAKYSSEAEQMLNQLTPAQRANPEAMNWISDQLKLKHMDDIIAEKVAEAVNGNKPVSKIQAFQRGSQSQEQPKVVKVKQSEYNQLMQEGLRLFGTKQAAEKYVRSRLDN